jgi:hypothetical protein
MKRSADGMKARRRVLAYHLQADAVGAVGRVHPDWQPPRVVKPFHWISSVRRPSPVAFVLLEERGMRTFAFLILTFVAAPAASAAPQSGAPVADPSLAAGSKTTEPLDADPPGLDQGTAVDPHGDRAVLLPTALTQPAGSFSISSYDLFFAGLTFGITDRLQVSTTALLTPFVGATLVVGNLKWQVLRHGPWRLSLNAGMSYAHFEPDEPTFGPDGQMTPVEGRLTPHLGAAVSYCLSDDCQSLLSASVQMLSNPERWRLGQSNAYFGASLVHRMTEHLKLVLEVTSVAGLYPDAGVAPGAVPVLALRYFRERVAFDGGVMVWTESQGQAAALPYLAGSFRF